MIPWEAAAEDHRALSSVCPILYPGLTEEVELRVGTDERDHALGGLTATPPRRLLLVHDRTSSLQTTVMQDQPKSVTIYLKIEVGGYFAVHSGAIQPPVHWRGERKERG